MSPAPVRILVVDDHYVVRVGLLSILAINPQFRVIAEAEDGAGALQLYRQHLPDVTLMDLRLPGMSGVDATAAILKEFPEARIIVLTTFDQEEGIYRALQAGARGYLSKRILGGELIVAVETVHTGGRYIPQEVAQRLAQREPASTLTDREQQVLEYMVKGFNNEEIGRLMGLTRFTAKFHVQNILQKLGVSGRTEAVAAAIHRGIIHLD